MRKRLGLTQGALARLLRLGSNTISRWEAGRNVQTAARDVLLRLIRDLPGSIEYLRCHGGSVGVRRWNQSATCRDRALTINR